MVHIGNTVAGCMKFQVVGAAVDRQLTARAYSSAVLLGGPAADFEHGGQFVVRNSEHRERTTSWLSRLVGDEDAIGLSVRWD
jgi:hypothetical protein